MKILLVEDDENKRDRISDFLGRHYPQSTLAHAKSYQSGLKQLLTGSFNLVLLDMSIPTFDVTEIDDGGRPQAYGGRELLKQMDRRKICTPVLVVTQFARFGDHRDALTLEQLDSTLRNEHSATYKGAVYYDSALEGWKDELAHFMNALVGGSEA